MNKEQWVVNKSISKKKTKEKEKENKTLNERKKGKTR